MFKQLRSIYWFNTVLILGLSASNGALAYEFDRIDNSSILIKATPGLTTETAFTVKAEIFEIKPIALLTQTSDKKPWPLVSGQACASCPEEEGLFLINPETGKHTAFVYPGKIYDPKINSHALTSRLFYGRCLRSGTTDGVVVFANELLEQKRWKRWRRYRSNSVFSAQLEPDKLVEKLHERGLPSLSHTLHQVKRKECIELAGRNRSALTRPMDLIIKPEVIENDNDTEADEKADEKEETEKLPD